MNPISNLEFSQSSGLMAVWMIGCKAALHFALADCGINTRDRF